LSRIVSENKHSINNRILKYGIHAHHVLYPIVLSLARKAKDPHIAKGKTEITVGFSILIPK
jgi:hypothetical protein